MKLRPSRNIRIDRHILDLLADTLKRPAKINVQATAAAKPSRMKLTAEKLRDMKAKWSANKGKLKACRKEVKAKGLVGDDRWFYIEDCMDKT